MDKSLLTISGSDRKSVGNCSGTREKAACDKTISVANFAFIRDISCFDPAHDIHGYKIICGQKI